ncbi:MAG TPA: hypothetical protein VEG66_02900 [Thermoplasmata archaeon]|nr:hypothetical protein [Thermoplasmata archaeon]HYB78693.1 hypothetical protein [Thermoplasmata archaeon]
MGEDTGPVDQPAFSDLNQHLASLDGRVGSMARRSRRFSWLSWGFLFATYLGVFLWAIIGILFPVVTVTTLTGGGTSTTTTFPWWDFPVLSVPPVAMLAFAFRELFLGRRETSKRTNGPIGNDPKEFGGYAAGWTGTVQRCQQRITHAKSEVEWSFVPIVLGWFSFVWIGLAALESVLAPGIGPVAVLLFPLVGLASIVLLYPLYRYAKGWIAQYQELLNRRVGELSKLEAEFLWRFAGGGLPT